MAYQFEQSPRIVSAFEVTDDSPSRPWMNPIHMHSHTELFFIQEGEGTFVVDQTTYHPKKGDVVIHQPFVEHREAATRDTAFRAISVAFKGLQIEGLPEGRVTREGELPLFHLQSDYIKINQYMVEMLEEYNGEKPGYVELSSSLLHTVLLLVLRNRQSARTSAPLSVSAQIQSYIAKNFHIDLTLNDLADVVHVSPYHLAHVFKEEVGVSPIQYLIKCRIEKAKELLTRTERSVADISMEVGYPNANYFNILFKKMTGENPGKYRSRRRTGRSEVR